MGETVTRFAISMPPSTSGENNLPMESSFDCSSRHRVRDLTAHSAPGDQPK
jgi:hypothetical protein